MLPCSIRRRSCSGEESTSSIWPALRTTQSGTRSRTFTPVMCSTSSAMLSRCWMLTVVITSMPAPRMSMTSCQRFSCGPDPGTFVCASSSMRVISGRLRGTASRSISSRWLPRYSTVLRGDDLKAFDQLLGEPPSMALDEADHHVGAPLLPTVTFTEHGIGLAYARGGTQLDTEMAGLLHHV